MALTRYGICLVGLPGAGKSTLASSLSAATGLPVFRGGAKLRYLSESQDFARNLLLNSAPIPVDMFRSMLEVYLSPEDPGVIFDGAPRSSEQVEVLLGHGLHLGIVVLKIAPSIAVERLDTRGQRSERIDDIGLDSRERVKASIARMDEVQGYALGRGIDLLEVDGTNTPSEVATLVLDWIRNVLPPSE